LQVIHIQDKHLHLIHSQNVDTRKELKDPAGSRISHRLAELIRECLFSLAQGFANTVFESRIDQQAKRHNNRQSHHAFDRFQKECRGHELRVFQKPETALDFLLILVSLQ